MIIIKNEKKVYATEGDVSIYNFIGLWLFDICKLREQAEILKLFFNDYILILVIDGYIQTARKYQKDNDIVIEISEYIEKTDN